MLRFGTFSESLREDMAVWEDWITNESLPFESYHAIMAAWLVTLDK